MEYYRNMIVCIFLYYFKYNLLLLPPHKGCHHYPFFRDLKNLLIDVPATALGNRHGIKHVVLTLDRQQWQKDIAHYAKLKEQRTVPTETLQELRTCTEPIRERPLKAEELHHEREPGIPEAKSN